MTSLTDIGDAGIRRVVAIVAAHFEVSTHKLLGPSHAQWVSLARHVAMYWCNVGLARSLPEIGRAFRRDHTTVLDAVRKITDRLDDARVGECLEKLRTDAVGQRVKQAHANRYRSLQSANDVRLLRLSLMRMRSSLRGAA